MHKQSGFSLIEIAIVLVLTAIFMISIIQGLNLYQAQRALNDTYGNMAAAKAGLTKFYSIYGHYPCPARMDMTFNAYSDCPAAAAVVSGTCADGGGVPQGICVALGRPADTVAGGDRILIGVLPYGDLNVGYPQVNDGWGRKLTYVVTENLTRTATFNDAYGAIKIDNEVGDTLINPESSAHLLIISHGQDGAGATVGGAVAVPCDLTSADGENCDNDGAFVGGLRSMAVGPQHFDDFIDFQLWGSTNLWAPSPGNSSNIYSRNIGGNVGIGTQNPTRTLDVSGNIRGVNVMGSLVCDSTGANCFAPSVIGGSGMGCANPAQAMTGIQNSTAVCSNVTIPSSFADTCPSGQFVTGITLAGTVLCATP